MREKQKDQVFKKKVLVILLFSTVLFSQNSTLLYSIMEADLSKETRIIKIDSLLKVFEEQKDDSLSYWYLDYAYWLDDEKELDKAIDFGKKALLLAKASPLKDTSLITESLTNLGLFYGKNKEPLKRIEVYNELILLDKESTYATNAYLKLGYCYLQIRNYYKAIDHFELAIQLLIKNRGNNKKLREAYQNIATTCILIRTKESLIKGQKYGAIADSLANNNPTSLENKYKIKSILAQLYNQHTTLDFETSLSYYNQALEIAKEKKDTSRIINMYYGLGDLYNVFDQKKSITALQNGIQLIKKKDSSTLGKLYFSMGYTYALGKEYGKSLKKMHMGLAYFTGDDFLNPQNIKQNFLIDFKSKINLLDLLPPLAETYLTYFEKTKNKEYLERSIAYFKLADQVIDLLKINSGEFKSRLFWREQSTDIYGKAIRAAYLSNNVEAAFYFMEKNKALLLFEDIANQEFKNSLELPKSYLEEEKALKKQIFQIGWNLKNEEEVSKAIVDSLKKELIDTKIILSNLKDSISERKNVISISPEIRSFQEVQEDIKEDEIVLEYHVSIDDGYGIYTNKENGYVFLITKNNIQLFEIPELSILRKEVSELISTLKEPFQNKEGIAKYTEVSNIVFKKLFPDEVIKHIRNKKITIIPDSYLSLLPFEVLSTNDKTLNYLIRDNEIHYLYSYSFLKNTEKEDKVNATFLGMAPETFDKLSLNPLENSENEIESLQSYYNGKSFMKGNALKETFLKELENYGIVHLATHAGAQDSISPWIAFSDKKLLLEELYLTKIMLH